MPTTSNYDPAEGQAALDYLLSHEYSHFRKVGNDDYRDPSKKNPGLSLSSKGWNDHKNAEQQQERGTTVRTRNDSKNAERQQERGTTTRTRNDSTARTRNESGSNTERQQEHEMRAGGLINPKIVAS